VPYGARYQKFGATAPQSFDQEENLLHGCQIYQPPAI